jgi:hypothetical protein
MKNITRILLVSGEALRLEVNYWRGREKVYAKNLKGARDKK